MLGRRLHGEKVQRFLKADREVQRLLFQLHFARLDL